jgi:hypothetical protein
LLPLFTCVSLGACSFGKAVNQDLKPTKVKADSKSPEPVRLTKISGDMALPEFKAGNLAQITGSKLTFDKTDSETGVYLQPDDGELSRITEYAKISDTLILLKMPDSLTVGNNSIEVRNRSKDGKINRGFLNEPIMIAA